jgi:hypothetical protein
LEFFSKVQLVLSYYYFWFFNREIEVNVKVGIFTRQYVVKLNEAAINSATKLRLILPTSKGWKVE